MLCLVHCAQGEQGGYILGKEDREDQDCRELKTVFGGGGISLSPESKELFVHYPHLFHPYACAGEGGHLSLNY